MTVMIAAVLLHPSAWAAFEASRSTFVAGDVHVVMAGGDGRVLPGPLFDDVVVTPGMAPITTTLVVMNTGDIAATYTIEFASHTPTTVSTVAAQVRLTVRDETSTHTVFDGPLDHLRIVSDGLLDPAARTVYHIATTWPRTAGQADPQSGLAPFDLVLNAIQG